MSKSCAVGPSFNFFVNSTEPASKSPDPDAIAELIGVSKRFGPNIILSEVNLAFKKGEVSVILGPSGAGKSVLIKHLVGLLSPDSGEIYVEGKRVDRYSEREFLEVRRRVGYMFQLGALFDSMTVGQNIAFPLLEHTDDGPAERKRKVEEVLRMVGLPGFESRYPTQISGGQQRRIAMARAIVLRPNLVLFDEPTTGLDPMRSDVISELILALTRNLGISSIVVTHDMNSARKIADRMVLLYNGRVVADACKDAFLASNDPLVRRFIRGEAEEDDLLRIHSAFAPVFAPSVVPASPILSSIENP